MTQSLGRGAAPAISIQPDLAILQSCFKTGRSWWSQAITAARARSSTIRQQERGVLPAISTLLERFTLLRFCPAARFWLHPVFISFDTGQVTNSAELYDPATGLWSLTGNLNTGRALH